MIVSFLCLLCSTNAGDAKFTFLTLGDWGKANAYTRNNAHAIGAVASEIKAQFMCLLGDNFYNNGVSSISDPLWQTGFEEIFTSPSISSIPFYAILGDVDYHGNESAQIAYYETHREGRWVMPDYNYTKRFLLPHGVGSLEIFAFDAIRVAYDAREEQDPQSDISNEEKIVRQQQQLNALESSLQISNADWKIVMGHYPVYSTGENGDTLQLLEKVVPLMKRYDVDMYLSSHNHILEHISWEGIEYFTIGKGTNLSESLRSESAAASGLMYADTSSIGFGAVTATADALSVTLYNSDGNSIYTYTRTSSTSLLSSSEEDEEDDGNSACTSGEDGEDEKAEIADWIWQGGVILFIIGMLFCFWGLALVCDHYFCAALIILCEETKIPDDVAGATVMAIGTSAADLMISVISLFVQESTVGLGTIIGSEIFNHLIISAACTMNSKDPIQLEPRLFSREVISYGLTLIILMVALNNASFEKSKYEECLSVSWYTGLFMMFFYILYALVVIYYDKLMLWTVGPLNTTGDTKLTTAINPMSEVDNEIESNGGGTRNVSRVSENSNPNLIVGSPSIYTQSHTKRSFVSADMSRDSTASHSWMNRSSVGEIHTSIHEKSVSTQVKQGLDPLEASDSMSTKKYLSILLQEGIYYCTVPLRKLISLTIPDLTKDENRSYYIWAMIASIIWLGLLAQGLLYCLDILGDMLGITDEMLGLTIGAWGASMPTLWSSLVVAKKGYGDMALSNAIGANVFSVLVGLGLPWFSYPLYLNGPYNGIRDSGILPLIVVLLGITILYYFFISYNKFVLEFWMGWFFLAAYTFTIILCTTVFDF